jgi:sigma-B regulation protein RsbU (phosphoserine phosphatase)
MQSDASDDEQRIASLRTLMRELRQGRTPAETFRAIRRGLRAAYGAAAVMIVATRGLGPGEYRVLELHLDESDDDDEPDFWKPQDTPVHRGGVVGEIIANPDPRIISGVDWTRDPVFGATLAGYSSVMAVPAEGDAVPIDWVLYLKHEPGEFATAELADAMVQVAMIGSLLESRALAEELARASEQIDRDLRQAGEVQRSLLPDPLPAIGGLEIAASYHPSSRAGGDLYDFFKLDQEPGDSERWCVLIADASGHGMAAALVMTMVQSILRAHPPRVTGPADLLGHVNRQLCRKSLTGFVTAFLGIYEPQSRRFSYACAGHPPPLVKTLGDGRAGAAAAARRLNAVASIPLGIDEAETFAEANVFAHPRDVVLLYTDGITEAWTPSREMFTAERLEQEFLQNDQCPAELVRRICDLVRAHEQGQPPADDQTVVAIAGV